MHNGIANRASTESRRLTKLSRRAFGTGLVASIAPIVADAEPALDPGLVDRARAEGSVVAYIAMSSEDIEKLIRKFQSTYQIQLHVLRLVSNQIPAKLQIEQRAGRFDADVQISPGYETDQMKRAGLLAAFAVPESRDYFPGYVDPAGYWTSCYTLTDAIMYNTDKLKAAGLKPPTSWADFMRPEWRGRFAMFSASYPWYAAMKRGMGTPAADALMRGLATNQPALLATHQVAATLTAAGEYTAALNVFAYEADRMKKSGAAVDFINAAPTVAELTGISIVKNAPHPNAARLFERWFLSKEGQAWMVETIGRISARKDIANNPAIWNTKMRVTISNPSDSLNYTDDVRAFNTIFGIAQ